MAENLEYMEDYFHQRLSDAQRKDFELRCENDKGFAEEVAFYITSRQALKEELLLQKRAQWKQASTGKSEELFFIKPFKRLSDYKWRYAAAAIIILAFGTYFFERSSSPQQLADNYIQNNFSQLSLTMDGVKDSMQTALAAFNNKEYDKASPVFESLCKDHPENNDALKDAGITYLVTKDYDKALEKFDALANKKGLFSNPGYFYKAITLLQRNKDGDKAEAKQLLEQVVSQNLEHSSDAKDWLKKF